ncbi:conserved membrane hypothetical protein [uncultured Microbacterium sp.]|uniref:Integral membrane protein n=1 Tax=uncultured Microbacterium sp. TaxID=191216 RepID=A0A1Y5P868_9MICO|nr:hypothetical protein [uncultured Microbacterium sp.]SBS74895.1 conserved membrane hypothetical protein [uncultured Microbacterium sp.]
MAVIAAAVAVAILTGLAVLQVCVAAGAPWGRFVWGGRHRVLPRRLRIGSAVSVLLYAVFAAILLARAGVLPGCTSPVVVVATWVLFGYFALGILMNLASRSPAERWTMAPACVVLAVLTAVVALS